MLRACVRHAQLQAAPAAQAGAGCHSQRPKKKLKKELRASTQETPNPNRVSHIPSRQTTQTQTPRTPTIPPNTGSKHAQDHATAATHPSPATAGRTPAGNPCPGLCGPGQRSGGGVSARSARSARSVRRCRCRHQPLVSLVTPTRVSAESLPGTAALRSIQRTTQRPCVMRAQRKWAPAGPRWARCLQLQSLTSAHACMSGRWRHMHAPGCHREAHGRDRRALTPWRQHHAGSSTIRIAVMCQMWFSTTPTGTGRACGVTGVEVTPDVHAGQNLVTMTPAVRCTAVYLVQVLWLGCPRRPKPRPRVSVTSNAGKRCCVVCQWTRASRDLPNKRAWS